MNAPAVTKPTKLTRAERKRWEQRLSQWHSPAEFGEAVRELHAGLDSEVLFNQGGLNFALEAWIAATFAKARRADQVRLVADVWPDVEICDIDGVHHFEVIEADVPGRERGREYKEAAEKRRFGLSAWRDASDEMRDRSTLVEVALRAAANKKVDKQYSGQCSLIIMLNFGAEFGVSAKEIGAILHTATEPSAAAFEDVWLLWRGDTYLLWRNGARVEVSLKKGYEVL